MQRTKLGTTFPLIKTTPHRPALGLAALKSREKCLGLTSCYPDEPDDTQRWQDFNLLFWAERKKPPDADEGTFDWAKGSSILKAQHWSQTMYARPSKTCRPCRQSSERQLLGLREKVHWDKPATEMRPSTNPCPMEEGCGIPGVLAPFSQQHWKNVQVIHPAQDHRMI